MRRITFLHIAREGWPLILLAGACALLAYGEYGVLGALPFVAAMIYLAAFFHDPQRYVPSEPLAMIAPVDGRVIYRREAHDPFLDREAVKISISVLRLGAYLIRAVSEGTVLELPNDSDGETTVPATWLRTDEGDDIVIAVSEGAMFGARPSQTRYGERVGQGRRCGMRRLARRVDIYLPPNSRIEVQIGQRVRAGCDVLATLVHKKANGVDNGAKAAA